MRIDIESTGPNLEAQVDEKFGRCRYFLFVDVDSLEFEALENAAAQVSAGAGVPAAMMVANRKASAILALEIGPAASDVLLNAGIAIYICARESILDAIKVERYGKFVGDHG